MLDSQLGMPGLGREKAGEKISKGAPKGNFCKFSPNIKGSTFRYKTDVLIL